MEKGSKTEVARQHQDQTTSKLKCAREAVSSVPISFLQLKRSMSAGQGQCKLMLKMESTGKTV